MNKIKFKFEETLRYMVNEKIIEKIDLLPPEYQQQVDNYIDFMLEQINIKPPEKNYRESGQLRGKVWMSPDFDAPLEDFKDFM